MACQQVEIGQGFDAGLALGGIAHHMVEYAAVGIDTGLVSVPVNLRLRQHGAVGGQDFASDNPVREAVQPGVVGIVDHILSPGLQKIGHVGDQAQKQGHNDVDQLENIPVCLRIWVRFFHSAYASSSISISSSSLRLRIYNPWMIPNRMKVPRIELPP